MYCCVQHYADNDLKLRRFVPIIQPSLVYPVILDTRRTVLSLPPIINGAHSAVRIDQSFCGEAPQMLSAGWPDWLNLCPLPLTSTVVWQFCTVDSLLQGSDVQQGCSECLLWSCCEATRAVQHCLISLPHHVAHVPVFYCRHDECVGL